MRNNAFKTYTRNDLLTRPHEIADAVKLDGICYITGFEEDVIRCIDEFDSLKLDDCGTVRTISGRQQSRVSPNTNSILNSPEFHLVKRILLGPFYRNAIETFVQSTGFTDKPASGELHFDKRRTIKVWAYIGDVSQECGAMRVVPRTNDEVFSSAYARTKLTKSQLRDKADNVHYPSADIADRLEKLAQPVTGCLGTVFIHDTDAWHGASPVLGENVRKIVRAHNRSLSDKLK